MDQDLRMELIEKERAIHKDSIPDYNTASDPSNSRFKLLKRKKSQSDASVSNSITIEDTKLGFKFNVSVSCNAVLEKDAKQTEFDLSKQQDLITDFLNQFHDNI